MLCLLNLLSYFEEVWCSFFSKCLVGFTSEAINWTQKFFCREFCDSITLFLCDSVLGGFVVLGICPLYLVIPFVGEQVFTVLYNDFFRTNTPKRCSFHHRELECKSRKSRDPWSNRQVWPWSIKWSRAKSNRVLLRERTVHSKHRLPTTQETTHERHQMLNAEIRLIIFFALEDGESL